MKKAAKILSVILILASGFGLFGGAMALNDAMNSKAYWENVGSAGDSLNQLEDGLNSLAENEDAYYDGVEQLAAGREEYEAGVQKLADGQAEYDAGKKLLEEKQAEYDEGLKKLEEAENTLWQAKLDLEQGERDYEAGVQKLAEAKKTLDAGEAQVAPGEALINGIDQVAAGYSGSFKPGFDQAKAGGLVGSDGNLYSSDDQLKALVNAGILQATGADYLDLLQKKAAMEASGIAPSDPTYQTVVGTIQAIEPTFNEKFETAKASVNALKKGRSDLTAGIQQIIAGVQGNAQMASQLPAAQVQALMAGLNGTDEQFYAAAGQFVTMANNLLDSNNLRKTVADGRAQLDEGYAEYAAGAAKLAAARKQLDEGYVKYQAGLAEYYDGLHMLQDGKRQLDEGYAKLEAAEKELESGKKQLADAKQQLEDGEKQLAVFEDGRDQVIAGLQQVMATETYPGISSIADRLGPDFSYMKDKKNLDIGKGLEVVAAARAFSADTTAAVTKEVVSKVAAALLTMLGSVTGAVGGLVGLFGKAAKASGILGAIGAVSAGAGLAVNILSGGAFSAVAGAAGPGLLDAASGVLAASGAAQSVTSFLKPKTPTPAP